MFSSSVKRGTNNTGPLLSLQELIVINCLEECWAHSQQQQVVAVIGITAISPYWGYLDADWGCSSQRAQQGVSCISVAQCVMWLMVDAGSIKCQLPGTHALDSVGQRVLPSLRGLHFNPSNPFGYDLFEEGGQEGGNHWNSDFHLQRGSFTGPRSHD